MSITNSQQLHAYGCKYIRNFVGVFPLDKLPRHVCAPGSLIVNTDTHNLQGQHWIALHYGTLVVYAFCPLGFYYPRILCEQLHKSGKKVVYNRTMYQKPWETTCGLHCLAFLQRV